MPKSLDLLLLSIQHFLDTRNLSKAEAAKLAHMSPQQFTNHLSGKSDVRLSFVDKVAKVFSTHPSELLMTGEMRDKLYEARAPNLVSAQEKLQVAAQLLNDKEAAFLLGLAEQYLQARSLAPKAKKVR